MALSLACQLLQEEQYWQEEEQKADINSLFPMKKSERNFSQRFLTRKSETLKAKEEIQRLFKSGKRVKAKHVSIVYAPNDRLSSRFLFCADRSARKANERNRIKRVLRALIASNQQSIEGNMDIALIASYGFTELSFEVRLKTLKNLFSKLES